MKRSSLFTWLAAVANTFLYAYIYRAYLNPRYSYFGGFDLLPRSDFNFAMTAVLTLLPLLLRSRRLSPGAALAAMIYVLYFIPLMWGVHYGLHRDEDLLLVFEGTLALCMGGLFLASRDWLQADWRVPTVLPHSLLAATAAMVAIIAWTHRDVMRLVGFGDVYELRFEAADAGIPRFVGYLVMWCTYCLIPYCFARALCLRDAAALAVGLAGSVVIYMATGAKTSILTPVILGGLYVAMRWRGEFLGKVMLGMAVLSCALLWLVPAGDIADWARSVYFMRTLGTGPFTTVAHYEYFSVHGYTYYSHIGAIDALTNGYAQYRPYQLGQLLGIALAGSESANFNGGFWASEGAAAWGIAGLPVATVLVAGYLTALNVAARHAQGGFAALWACGYGMALVNLPLSTAMGSGGGLLLLLLLIFVRAPGHAGHARRSPDAKSTPLRNAS
jgi:hypothetical protein